MTDDNVVWFMPKWLRDMAKDYAFTEENLYEFALMEQQEARGEHQPKDTTNE